MLICIIVIWDSLIITAYCCLLGEVDMLIEILQVDLTSYQTIRRCLNLSLPIPSGVQWYQLGHLIKLLPTGYHKEIKIMTLFN